MMTDPEAPSGDVRVTARCAACQGRLPAGRARPVLLTPADRTPSGVDTNQPEQPRSCRLTLTRRDGTVYACAGCQSRYLGEGPRQGLGNGQ